MGQKPSREEHKEKDESFFETEGITLKLSKSQVELIRESWPCTDFDTMYETGRLIFQYMFDKSPEAKQFFTKILPDIKKKYIPNSNEDERLKQFFLNFVQVISLTVKNLRQIDTVVDPMLIHVGKEHAKVISRGFKITYWKTFPEATAKTIIKQLKDLSKNKANNEKLKEVEEAWLILATYMVQKISEGFYAEKTRRNI